MKIPGVLVSILDGLFKNWINETCSKYLSEYGKLIDHKICFQDEPKIYLTIKLLGEKEPFDIVLSGIKVTKETDGYFLHLRKINIDREWMQKLGEDYLNGKFGEARQKLPDNTGKLLHKVFR